MLTEIGLLRAKLTSYLERIGNKRLMMRRIGMLLDK